MRHYIAHNSLSSSMIRHLAKLSISSLSTAIYQLEMKTKLLWMKKNISESVKLQKRQNVSKAERVKSTMNIAYMQEKSYYNDQPTAYSRHKRSAYQPWNQYSMNCMCQHMPLQAMYVPSQLPVSQMLIYNQLLPIGYEPTVTMSTYLPRWT